MRIRESVLQINGTAAEHRQSFCIGNGAAGIGKSDTAAESFRVDGNVCIGHSDGYVAVGHDNAVNALFGRLDGNGLMSGIIDLQSSVRHIGKHLKEDCFSLFRLYRIDI